MMSMLIVTSNKKTHSISLECVLVIAGMNDFPEDARRLVRLLRGIRCKVNLIPLNEFPGNMFGRPADEVIDIFQGIVRDGGLDVFLRKSRGDEVLGACGQLGRSASDVLRATPADKKRDLPIYAQP